MELGLAKKMVAATGAGHDIDAPIAAEIARGSMHLCLVVRDSDKFVPGCHPLGYNSNSATIPCGTAWRDPIAAVIRVGQLDLLVNYASATKRADFFIPGEDDWQDECAGFIRNGRRVMLEQSIGCNEAVDFLLSSKTIARIRLPLSQPASSTDPPSTSTAARLAYYSNQ